MMRFLIICLLLSWLSGCYTEPPEPPDPPSKVPFYVNNSGVDINLIVVTEVKHGSYIGDDTIYYRFTQNRYKQEIKNNDTLCNSHFNKKNCSRKHWIDIIAYAYENYDFILASFKIEFLSEPKTCLAFSGDKADNDIRYWENYTLEEETPSHLMHYYYITQEHKAMAKEEDCGY